MTLLAIPWAQSRNILGFNKSPLKYTTIFIINLAFSDFLYCVTNLPMYSITYFRKGWDDDWTCAGFGAWRNLNAFAAWMALGFVALSRFLSLCSPRLCKLVSIKNRNLLSVGFVWLYAFFLVLPTIFSWYGKFGYDPELGKCGYLSTNPCKVHPRKVFFSIAFFLPLSIMVKSYFTIWRTCSTNNSTVLKTNLIRQNRDRRMTRTLFGLCFCYVIFVGPIVIATLFDFGRTWNLICFVVYWMQYTTNFVLYAGRNKEYRKAYVKFLRTALPWLFEKKQSNNRGQEIFVISVSAPEMTVSKKGDRKNVKLDLELHYRYSLDLGTISCNLSPTSENEMKMPENGNSILRYEMKKKS